MTDINDNRALALTKAVELINSGRMTTNIGISTVIQAADEFHTFLTADQTVTTASGTPSDTSTEPASTPVPSKPKVTAPAQPDNPVDF